ncbi:MAG: TIGR03936 family radical SAM-associated protein, partial [Planctomycetia bacterium]|nr:TIGR03936 family radical SAM-associated protein [Planctomycetia bacterium]
MTAAMPDPMLGDKFRFRFAKSGMLRLVSHHDLMRCAERMLRRAAVPFKSTAGFHPTPRLVFALSLPLGVVGRDEVVELELTQPRDCQELLAALAAQAPAGLTFTRVSVVPMKATATPRRVVYELPLPAERAAEVESAVSELLSKQQVWVERLRPSPKRLNIRPYVRGVSVNHGPTPQPPPCREGEKNTERFDSLPGSEPASFSPSLQGGGWGVGSSLRLDLWVTQTGTARADELLRLLGVSDLIEAGAVLERTQVEIRDEVPAHNPVHDPADGPPDGPADSQRLTGSEVAALTARLEE